jgi:hypothetical protein
MEIVIDLNEQGAVCVSVQCMEEGDGALIQESCILFLGCGPSGCRPVSYVRSQDFTWRKFGWAQGAQIVAPDLLMLPSKVSMERDQSG